MNLGRLAKRLDILEGQCRDLKPPMPPMPVEIAAGLLALGNRAAADWRPGDPSPDPRAVAAMERAVGAIEGLPLDEAIRYLDGEIAKYPPRDYA